MGEHMADELEFKIVIVAPNRSFYDGMATMVEFNTTEGQIGIYKGHVPTTVIIAPGILTITLANGEKKEAALHDGFVEILQDKVVIMAEVVEWPDEIDESRALASKERAEKRLMEKEDGIDLLRAETAMQRATARISVKR
jgi:F-type H+-transporting ATPase subunit epsilon